MYVCIYIYVFMYILIYILSKFVSSNISEINFRKTTIDFTCYMLVKHVSIASTTNFRCRLSILNGAQDIKASDIYIWPSGLVVMTLALNGRDPGWFPGDSELVISPDFSDNDHVIITLKQLQSPRHF